MIVVVIEGDTVEIGIVDAETGPYSSLLWSVGQDKGEREWRRTPE
jgi:hypothetical protein